MIYDELLSRYKTYIFNSNNLELFLYSKYDYYYENDKSEIKIRFNELNGIGIRKFLKDNVLFDTYDSLSISNILNNKSQKQMVLPPVKMVCDDKGANGIDIKELNNTRKTFFEETNGTDFLNSILNKEKKYKLSINKILFQYQEEKCILINSKGVEGYYKKTLFSPSIIFNNKLIYDIYPIYDEKKWNDLWCFNNNSLEKKMFIEDKIEYILFSPIIFGQIIFLLMYMLQYELICTGTSKYKLDDIGKKAFSEFFSMEENSKDNCSLIGNCDGNGLRRKPTKIVDKGIISNFISSVIENNCSGSSAYRLSYKQPPITKASKVSILSNISKKEFDKKNIDYLLVNDLLGINESYDLISSHFTSKGMGIMYKNGKPFYNVEFNINASVEDILSEIIYITDEKKYVLDGSVITGAALIKNKNFI